MVRVSLILKNAREDKDLNIDEISKKLKIPGKYIDALESERIKEFPPDPYCSLIIKDYANFLGLNGNDVLALFRRDFDRRTKNKSLTNHRFHLTPHTTFKAGVLLLIFVFISYLSWEYYKFNQPPALNVSWPETTPANVQSIELTGSTNKDSTIKINQDLIIVDSNGNFKKKVVLTPPETKITVESTSPNGKTTTVEKIFK